jgi:hypothetical protein
MKPAASGKKNNENMKMGWMFSSKWRLALYPNSDFLTLRNMLWKHRARWPTWLPKTRKPTHDWRNLYRAIYSGRKLKIYLYSRRETHLSSAFRAINVWRTSLSYLSCCVYFKISAVSGFTWQRLIDIVERSRIVGLTVWEITGHFFAAINIRHPDSRDVASTQDISKIAWKGL